MPNRGRFLRGGAPALAMALAVAGALVFAIPASAGDISFRVDGLVKPTFKLDKAGKKLDGGAKFAQGELGIRFPFPSSTGQQPNPRLVPVPGGAFYLYKPHLIITVDCPTAAAPTTTALSTTTELSTSGAGKDC